jgi:hypothetical protein
MQNLEMMIMMWNRRLQELNLVIILVLFMMNWKWGSIYVMFCNKTLHRCEKTFENECGNTCYEGEMMFKGVWYYRITGQQGENFSYKLLANAAPTFVYSHHVVASKLPMFPIAKKKGDSRFFMAIEDKAQVLAIIKERQTTDN